MSTVWLHASAREAVASEAVRRRIVETGGPLFGYVAEGSVFLTKAFGPGPGARHRPTSLSLDPAWIQQCIDETWEASGRAWGYVGEWHSHPGGRARPSGRDIRATMEIASDLELHLPEPIILIQATKIFRRMIQVGDLAAFRWDSRAGDLEQCALRVASLEIDAQLARRDGD